MTTDARSEAEWVARIRGGDEAAWQTLIDQFEGRLLAFARRRLADVAAAEDVVQETFVGFLISLPNYDTRRKLESYLFSICGNKLTDHLRRTGRRPMLPLLGRSQSGSEIGTDPVGRGPAASSIARSGERRSIEEQVIVEAITELIARWRDRENLVKLQAIELLFVVGRGNTEVADRLGLSQQQVANLKSDFLTRIKAMIARKNLDPAVFPELG